MRKKLGRVKKTKRGFEILEFKDHYGKECSLQQSSAALVQMPGAGAVWLGIDDPTPMVLWHNAKAVGVATTATEGWVPYPIPEEVSLHTRMHLNRKQVAALIQHLQAWLDTGSIRVKAKK